MAEALKPTTSKNIEQKKRIFRSEAIVAKNLNSWLGEHKLRLEWSYWFISGTALILSISAVIVIFSCSYTKVVRAQGRLVPIYPISYVISARNGYVRDLKVKVGDRVQATQILGMLETSHADGRGIDAEKQKVELIANKIRWLSEVYEAESSEIENKKAGINKRSEMLESLQKKLQVDYEACGSQIARRERYIRSYKELVEIKALSAMEYGEQLDLLDTLKEKLRTIAQKIAASDIQQKELNLENEEIGASKKALQMKFLISKTTMEQELLDSYNAQSQSLISNIDGTVTFVGAANGKYESRGTPLIGVIPPNNELIADISLDSSQVGLLKVGQTIKIKYDTFSYQRFGSYRATLISVDSNARSSADAEAKKNIFHALAKIEDQSIVLNGQKIELKAGLTFEALTEVESRKIYQWLLLPLNNL